MTTNHSYTAIYKIPRGLPYLSIIIVSYNTKEVTDNCLASIYAAKWRASFEVIVVDNGSSDESVEMIQDKYPEVKLIANPDNRLFAIANNQGAKIAQGKYLLLLNSDTLVYDDNLQRMIDYFETLPEDVICVGPKILNFDKTIQSMSHPRWGTIIEHFLHLVHAVKLFPCLKKIYPTLPHNSGKIQDAGWVAGCAMMIRRDKYNFVGGLNEKIEFYGEEPEFGYGLTIWGSRQFTIHRPKLYILVVSRQRKKRQMKKIYCLTRKAC